MQNLYGVEPGETWWCGSDIGWVVGHSYIVYGPLLHGATSVLYEGKPVGTPDAGAFWRVISEHGAVAFFTGADRVPRDQEGRPAGASCSRPTTCRNSARCFSPASAPTPTPPVGRAAPEKTCHRSLVADRDRLVHRRQSGRASGNCRSNTARRRWRCRVTTCACRRAKQGIAGRHDGFDRDQLPLPPAVPADAVAGGRTLRGELPREFPGYYKTADAGFKDEDGYVYRDGPHRRHHQRRGPSALDRRHGGGARAHQDVAECAVLGIKDELKGEVPCGFIVLKAGVNRAPAEIEKECVALVREKIGPVAAFKLAITVGAAAEDALGKNPARHHEEDRRRRTLVRCRPPSRTPKVLDEIGPGAAERGKGCRRLERPRARPSRFVHAPNSGSTIWRMPGWQPCLPSLRSGMIALKRPHSTGF
jgi:propionyl-CoA synthetase